MSDPDYVTLRRLMVGQIAAHTIFLTGRLDKAALDGRVIDAMERVPRHDYVRDDLKPMAYADSPLPSGCGKTISQPFIVAVMTDLLQLQPTDSVLEIGTGLGYQTAVLAELARQVCSIELIDELAREARRRLARAGYANLQLRCGDGRAGWPERAPFDKIILTAAADEVPAALVAQLRPGGRLVAPVGPAEAQQLLLLVKDAEGRVSTRKVLPVRFSLLDAS